MRRNLNVHRKLSWFLAIAIVIAAVPEILHGRQASSSSPQSSLSSGNVISVSTEAQLQAAFRRLTSNTTIVVAPGTYHLTRTLTINGPYSNLVIRGATNDPNDVVLRGRGMSNASPAAPANGLTVAGGVNGIGIANLTLRDFHGDAIALNAGTKNAHIYHVRLLDAGDHFIRTFPGGADNGVVEYSIVEYSTTAAEAGKSAVEIRGGSNWTFRHNLFSNITAPAGELAGPALLVHDLSSNTIAEGNTFLNTSRAIAFGLEEKPTGFDHQGGVIRNNVIFRSSGQGGGAAIALADSPTTKVLNNTAFLSGTYATPIEYRFSRTTGVTIENNLLDGFIWARDGATGTELNNLTGATADLFADAAAGDLRLAPTATSAIDRGIAVPDVTDDVEGKSRPSGGAPDIGASEFQQTGVRAPVNPVAANTATSALLVTAAATAGSGLAIDTVTSMDQEPKAATVTTNPFSTSAGNELLLAFIAADGLSTSANSVTSVTGAGLTWQLVRRTNVQSGMAEVWRAFAAAPLSNVTVTATIAQTFTSSLTVVSFIGADPSGSNGSGAIGATATANANPGAPTATLTTTRDKAWVFGVGNDWDGATARAVGPNQTMVHQDLSSGPSTFWVQRQNAPTSAAGTSVTINDTAPAGNRYNLTLVEVLPAGAADTTAPTVSVTAPANGATVSGAAVTVSATASDNVGVAGVQFKLDGANYGAEDTAGPYTRTWDTTTATNGTHTLTAVARDAAGNTTTSATVTVTVGNTPADTTAPTVSVTAPASGATVTGTAVTVSATASDNVGVVGVQFKLDGANWGAENTAGPYTKTWDTTTATDGTHTLSAVARDAAGNTATSAAVTVTVSNTAPPAGVTIFPASAVPGGFNTADTKAVELGLRFRADVNGTITALRFFKGAGNTGTHVGNLWTNTGTLLGTATFSNETASGWQQVTFSSPVAVTANTTYVASYHTNVGQYAIDSGYFATSGTDNAPLHALADGADGANGVYLYGAGGFPTQQAGGRNFWVDVVFKPSGPSDTTAPTVSVTAPANGATVSGSTVTVTATASDNVGVAGVQFRLDGANWGAEDTAGPYTKTWDTTTVTNGTHTVAAVARDAAGNKTTSATVTVTVSNTPADTTAPTVSVTAPANGATVSGSAVTVTATASDNVGVAGVQFRLDGANWGAEDTAGPYTKTWDTTTATNGTHTLTAVARDAAGNTTTAATVTVTVSNATAGPPTTIVFTKSSDHDNGVTGYLFEVFANGADPNTATPVASSALGKPTPAANGDITVDRTSFFSALAPGTYVATVSAQAAAGSARSAAVTFTR